MKLFVDDYRECPKGWTLVRTVTEAIRAIATMRVEEVSLDHDIQCKFTNFVENSIVPEQELVHASLETFEPVARFLFEYDCNRTDGKKHKVRIHTSNFEKGAEMAKIMMVPYTPKVYNAEDYK